MKASLNLDKIARGLGGERGGKVQAAAGRGHAEAVNNFPRERSCAEVPVWAERGTPYPRKIHSARDCSGHLTAR